MVEGGYDVTDYRAIDPLFGTLAEAETLIQEAHRHGLRVLADIVPNHTSDQHPWFQAALVGGPGSPSRQRYVFRPGRGQRRPPAAQRLAQRVRQPRLDAGHRAGRRRRVVSAPVQRRATGPQLRPTLSPV
jgi:glycosidase